MAPIVYSIEKWLSENEKFFLPPICNKLMYKDGQLKAFFVGGPNTRKDFHMEEGEEFFYMMKGDMNLIVVEQGKFKDVIIKEGEVFLLPARIPHSPQRSANTLGLVIERERLPEEIDCLRYYINDSSEVLYERWFHCDSLDSQLPPLIKEYFESEQFKTGKPLPGSILQNKPVKQDFNRLLDEPFSLAEWLNNHKKELTDKGRKILFEGNYESRISVLGNGIHIADDDFPETFLWQLAKTAVVETEGKKYELKANFTMLVEPGKPWRLTNNTGALTLSVAMEPRRAKDVTNS